MKLWLTSSEIADLALPGMPATRQNVIAMAEREGWSRFSALCRPRGGRGGGMEYHVNLLPIAARVAYFGPQAGQEAGTVAGEALQAAPEPPAGASSNATLQLDARLAVLAALRAFLRSSELKQTVAISYFVDLYNLGRVDVPVWARNLLPRLANRTLLRWLSAARGGETERLAVDRGTGRRGSGVFEAAFDGEIKHFALAVHSFNDLYTANQIHETIQREFGARLAAIGLTLPGLRAFELKFKAWRQEYAAGLLQMMDPDGFRSKMRISGTYDYLAPHLNALWQIDASPVDALCTDGRHTIYLCIDIWSRRIVLFVSKTPRSEAVQLLMRKAILAWGAPDAVKTDNGSDFVARATVRLFAKLQIEAIRSDAYSPWQKGVVERHIRIFQTDCARMLPGFVGHNVAQRKKIEGRKSFAQRLGQGNAEAFGVAMASEELQAVCDQWAGQIYAQRHHSKLGMAPFTRAASSTRPIRTVDPEALATLLMQAPDGDGYRTAGKNGIRVGGFHYLAPGILPGERAFVVHDPADKGTIWLFADESRDRLLGRGVNSQLAGVDPAQLLAETRAAQKRVIEAQTAEIRKQTKRNVTERTVLDNRLALAAEQAGNLVAFPPRSEIHATPALDAGLEVAAMRRGDAPTARPLSDSDARIMAELEAEPISIAPPPVNVRRLRDHETPQLRYRRWLDLHARMEAGQPITPEEAAFYGGFAGSSEKRGLDGLYEEFGEAALR